MNDKIKLEDAINRCIQCDDMLEFNKKRYCCCPPENTPHIKEGPFLIEEIDECPKQK